MKAAELHSFTGLPGVRGTLQGPIVRSVNGVMQAFKTHRICALASDHGAIEAWRDDAGIFRAHLLRRHVSVKDTSAPNKTGLYGWIVYAIREMQMPQG